VKAAPTDALLIALANLETPPSRNSWTRHRPLTINH
jgi:hypothetical protein